MSPGDSLRDLRHALRLLARNPGYAAAAALTLGLGIGANTAIFSVVHGVLLRPLAYAQSDRLVAVFQHEGLGNEGRNPTSPAAYGAWRESRSLQHMTAARPWSPVLLGQGAPDQLAGLLASPSLFRLLGVRPLLGRAFEPEAVASATQPVVVIGHELWHRRFGGDPGIVGRALQLDGEAHTVIAVMPPGFSFPPFWAAEAELWAPLRLTAEQLAGRSRFLRVFARLGPGVDLRQAQAEMDAIARRLERDDPARHANTGVRVEPLREPVVAGVRPALLALAAAAGFVLLIACANVAHLLLARAAAREREIAVRLALGATTTRIVRQLLIEGLALAGLALGLAFGLADATLRALRAWLPGSVPRLGEVRLDAPALAFACAAGVACVLLFGLAPALHAARAGAASLAHAGRGTTAARGRLPGALVVAELASALVLLVGAGLFLRSFHRLQGVDAGFEPGRLLTAVVSLAGPRHAEPDAQARLVGAIQQRAAALPGVQAAAVTSFLPIGGDLWRMGFLIEGRPAPGPSQELPRASYRIVTPGYLRAMGTPLLHGRDFSWSDTAERVAVVNRTLALAFGTESNALGRRIRLGREGEWAVVIGVAADVRQASLADDVRPEIYLPYTRNPVAWHRQATLVVRTAGDVGTLARDLGPAVWSIDPELPVTQVRSMDDVLSRSLRQPRAQALLTAVFAATALALALVGTYGVIANLVGRRRAEIGIRIALGARPEQVTRLVIAQASRLLLAGIALGLTGALALAGTLRRTLFGVPTLDPPSFAAAALVLGATALVACWLPARRGARLDPMASLREER